MLHRQILHEILERRVRSSRGRANPRGVKRKMTNYNVRRSAPDQPLHVPMRCQIHVIKRSVLPLRRSVTTAAPAGGMGYVIAAAIVNGSILFGDTGGMVTGTGLVVVSDALPTVFALHPNAPNPFNSSTEIPFDLPEGARVRAAIYNLTGQLIAVPLDAPMAAGTHRIRWNATGQSSGVYPCLLRADESHARLKMLLVR